MKKVSLSKTLLLTGSILTLAFSCTCQSKREIPMPSKGPEQEPFENCECIDCECEEGAASDVLNEEQEPTAVMEEASDANIVEEVEQKVTVTPIVVEAVKKEEPAAVLEATTAAAQESAPVSEAATAAAQESAPVSEAATAAAQESAPSSGETPVAQSMEREIREASHVERAATETGSAQKLELVETAEGQK